MKKRKKVIISSVVSVVFTILVILNAHANSAVPVNNWIITQFKGFGRFEFAYATASNVAGVEDRVTNNQPVGTPQRLSGDYGGRISRIAPNGKVYGGGGNSSSSSLNRPSGNAVIYKAYLVQESTGHSPEESKIMAEIPMTLKGPKGGQIKAEPKNNYVYNAMMNSSDTIGLTSTVTDVTDFVKSQGFGTYEGWDIPYYNRADRWLDQIGSWKLIVICEDENLPIRMVRLDLGCKSTNATYVGKTEVTIDGDGVRTKANGAISGQVLIGGSGGDPDYTGSVFEYSPSSSIGHFNLSTGTYGNINKADAFYQGVATENGNVRTDIKSVGNRVSDGLPFQNTDMILMNVNNTQSNMSNGHNAYLVNNSDKVSVRATTVKANGSINAFGLIADIDVATYSSNLSHTGTPYMNKELVMNAHVENNTNVDKVNLGAYGGYSVIDVDSNIRLNANSIVATFTDRYGNQSTLPNSLISVNGNRIKVTFGTSSEGISHKGDRLDVTFKGVPTRENITVSNNLAMYATHWIDESNRNHAFEKLTLMTNANDTFNIVYNNPPVITGTDKVFYQGQYTSKYWLDTLRWKDMNATDIEDGNITSKVKVTYDNVDVNVPNVYRLIYSVTDSGGKSTSKEVKVTVKYNNPPTISGEDRWFYVDEDVTNARLMERVKANDIEDGNITSKAIIKTSNVQSGVIGDYKVTYKVTDAFGKSAETTVNIHIVTDIPEGDDREQYLRFINKDYMNTLKPNSSWLEGAKSTLLNDSVNKTDDSQAKEHWQLTKEDIERIKAFNDTHDISQESNQEFLEQFGYLRK